jgi:3-deoxy-D-manno-octulosonic-acid transferase
LPVVEAFRQNYKVFIAGSSWQPDEELFIRFFNEHKDWRIIIAPHVIGEDHLQQILSRLDRKTVRYTQTNAEEASSADCLIIDCFGLLSSIYHYGDVAYIGGGFGVGIHNVLEAAVWGIPVIFGPNNKHFNEAQSLLADKGGFEITDYDGFKSIMSKLMTDEAFLAASGKKAGENVKKSAGATTRILNGIKGL